MSPSLLVSNYKRIPFGSCHFSFILFDSCSNFYCVAAIVVIVGVAVVSFHIVKLQIPLSLWLQKQCQTRVFGCQYIKKRRRKEMLMMY